MLHNSLVALLAYLIDKFFGEFHFIRHPVILIGDLITFFERHFYKDSILRGLLLLLFTLSITTTAAIVIEDLLHTLPTPLAILALATIASMFLAHNMLKSVLIDLYNTKEKHHALSMLVSRDTENLTPSEIYKAAIETYAENLSDGVIAPLFYLLIFGLPGIVFYKTVNTLDSMVGYKNKRYRAFGKASARFDDLLNFIPARITAMLITCLAKRACLSFYNDGKKHESPNAGHPITAMALALDLKLGGDTSYFGRIKKKADFGSGKSDITPQDMQKMFAFWQKIEATITLSLLLFVTIALLLL